MCHDTNDCIVTGGADLVLQYSTPGLRYGASALRHRSRGCDTVRNSARRHAATRCTAQHVTRTATRPVRAATRSGVRCDTASGAPLYGRPSAQWARSLGSGCAPCAPNPVLTQCTVLSYCFGHCSLALFTRF